jgi:hypothetical protein
MTKSAEGQPKSRQENPAITGAWLNGFGLNPFAGAGEAYGAACSSWLRECARFTTERLEKDRKAGTRLASCENLYDFAQLQQEWMQEVLQDYMRESNRVAELAFAIGADVFRPGAPNGGKPKD